MYKFIGKDPSFYDEIYNLGNIDDISLFIKNKFNIDYKIPKLQTGGGGGESIDINSIKEEIPQFYKKIEKLTSTDYEIYSEFLN